MKPLLTARFPCPRDAVDAMELVREVFMTLLPLESAGSGDSVARETVLVNMLRCVERIEADEQGSSNMSINHKFKLLGICESVLRNPQLPEAAGEVGRELRMTVAEVWSCDCKASNNNESVFRSGPLTLTNGTSRHIRGANDIFDALDSYLSNLRNLDQSEFDTLKISRYCRYLALYCDKFSPPLLCSGVVGR